MLNGSVGEEHRREERAWAHRPGPTIGGAPKAPIRPSRSVAPRSKSCNWAIGTRLHNRPCPSNRVYCVGARVAESMQQ